MTRRSLLLALGLAAVLASSQARADSITTLFSTGVDNNHALLAPNAPDTHYIMAAGSSDGTAGLTPFVVPTAPGFPIPPWAANTATAQWITPKMPEPVDGPFNYTTTFNLTGLTPGTASITGKLSADDQVVGVELNGVLVSPPITTPDQSYGTLQSFSITSGFVNGINTLEFLTSNNHGAVTGFIADMTGTAFAVPEPTSLAMLLTGACGLLTFRRLFKRASVA
jgi:PEP-CTERM motif